MQVQLHETRHKKRSILTRKTRLPVISSVIFIRTISLILQSMQLQLQDLGSGKCSIPMRKRRLPVMQASKPAASKCRSWHWSAKNTCMQSHSVIAEWEDLCRDQKGTAKMRDPSRIPRDYTTFL